jgi:DNA polymerase-3 subunit delta
MPEQAPTVYLLHGDDDYAISEFIADRMEKLGDKTMAEMNTTRLEARSCSLEELVGAVSAMPFLVSRRLVILTHPLDYGKYPDLQKRFKEILNKVPNTTALILVEDHLLTNEKDKRKKRLNWLEKWALEAEGKAFLRSMAIPTGPDLTRWIQRQAKAAGGQINPQAAEMLKDLVGPEPRLLEHEIEKLLAYANYKREVDLDDVQHLTPSVAKVQDFALVNALRAHDCRQALSILHRELEEKYAIPIFQGIVYQFRQLLLAREVLDEGGGEDEVVRQLSIHPYVGKLAAEHARRFNLPDLEMIYHRLLELDEAMKTGGMEGELALDVLVTELSS